MHGGDVQQRAEQEVPAHGLAVAGLALQVQLGADHGLIVVHHLARVEVARVRPQRFQQPGAEAHHLEVALHALLDARAQHLDHHLAAVEQGGGVHLGHRGGGQRRVVEMLEDLVQRTRQAGLHQPSGLGAVERRHPVLQVRQGLGPFRWQHVPAGGHQLAELDENRAQALQRQLQALALSELAGAQPAGGHQILQQHQKRTGRVGRQQG